jgi:hypothetical protein
MDVIDAAQYQESLVRENEISNSFKKIIYKCEICKGAVSPIAKIRRWCSDCYESVFDGSRIK